LAACWPRTAEERIQRYREATRLDPAYARAWMELGKTYYNQHEVTNLRLPHLEPGSPSSATVAREANFYLGLAAYAHGDFEKSETAFEFVAARLPLAEVYNNLGSRRCPPRSETEPPMISNAPSRTIRAIADYHFNLAVV
jgi:tetratricopeptide (TPR) repeat protein